jgi:hypothetical protein
MATLIDTLIVSLSLDPKGFDSSQKKSVEALRDIETHARGIQYTLNNLSSQGRRTGSSIASGAAAGTVGLKNLAIAGAEAFASFKTIEGIIGRVAAASERGAAVSRAAWATGLPTHQLDTLAQAAYEMAHVPQEATVNTLNAYQQRIEENKRTGAWSQEFTEAGRLGINIQAPILDQIKQIRAALQGKSGPETQAWVNAMGLGPMLQYLKLSQSDADTAERRASQHSLTKEQGQELERLQTAAARFEDAMTHLWETLSADFSKSGLSTALEGFSALLDSVSKNEGAMKALEVATGVVAAGSVITLASALWRLVAALNAVWATPLLGVLRSGAAARFLGPLGAFVATMWPSAAGNQSEIDAAKKLFDESKRRSGAKSFPGRPLPGGGFEAPIPPAGAPATGGNTTSGYPFPVVGGGANRPEFPNLPAPSGYAPERGPGFPTSPTPTNDNIPPPRSDNRPRDLLWVDSLQVAQQRSALSTIRASAGANGATRSTTNNDIAANIGQITIHTQPTETLGVGGAVSGSIKDLVRKNTLINSANSGLE